MWNYPPIRNIPVPHLGQVPFMAFLLFFIVILLGFFISRLALHLTQYAFTAAGIFPPLSPTSFGEIYVLGLSHKNLLEYRVGG